MNYSFCTQKTACSNDIALLALKKILTSRHASFNIVKCMTQSTGYHLNLHSNETVKQTLYEMAAPLQSKAKTVKCCCVGGI